uniref:Immunoglobulin V-set domain-containing protein n=1 Tax=Amphilophus citrinellus TaxID=61819 RepID=A0A3Q0RJF9_AMPCI
ERNIQTRRHGFQHYGEKKQHGKFDPDNQNPSFKNRNVTTADSGTYECRVQRENGTMELISIINLRVVAPPVVCLSVLTLRQAGGLYRAYLPLTHCNVWYSGY